MSVPSEFGGELVALAVAALDEAALTSVEQRVTDLATTLPAAVGAALFDLEEDGLHLVCGAGWEDRPGHDRPVPTDLSDLPAGTGAITDAGIAARRDEHEVVTVGHAGGRSVVLVTVYERDQADRADVLALLADAAQVAAVAAARRRAEAEARGEAERFEALVRSSPDAIVVADLAGTVLHVNPQTVELFGYGEDELVGNSVDQLLPETLRSVHARHRQRFAQDPEPRAMAAGRDLFGRRKDGTEVPVDVSLGLLDLNGQPAVAAFVRDATERRRVTEMALALHDAAVRRRQALEINDGVVQGLASVVYTLEAGDPRLALDAARRTIHAARLMMNDLMSDSNEDELAGGNLVRGAAPVSVLGVRTADRAPAPAGSAAVKAGVARVLVVDDAEDLRMLLKITVSSREGFEVVGEAADGVAAIEAAEELRPDVILLDLAMPVMDGFEALPRLRQILPDAAIVVLSGFDAARMEHRALDLGADRYVEKGTPTAKLLALLDELVGVPASGSVELPADPYAPLADDLGVQKLSHELRTPLTVIRSMIETLHDQMDALPAAAVREILVAAARNADVMGGLLDSVSVLHRIGTGDLVVAVESTDVGALVEDLVTDLRGLMANHVVEIDVQGQVEAAVDPLRVRQVITNLLSNAARFAPPRSRIEVQVSGEHDRVLVSVTDHGPGVPDERVHELFERFSRLGVEGRGMGLGLYISRAIARAHGGELRHEVPAAGGARFVLELRVQVDSEVGTT
ncbi:MAG TPA: ATP-binding protein [Nitriliruptorales bacterium]